MKPRYLEIEGLQSFKEIQKINFDELSETGLFGIFGPTGSGKSTILDAITLALYGKVNRAAMGTQGIINANNDKVRVTFVFDLLKNDRRKTYRVERVYVKKKGTENSCEAKIIRLFEVNDDMEKPLADKLTDVNAKVEELLGLKHDDFTRAVVLPQNKFQEFLLMDKSKKREMLERIFYLEEYGKELNAKLAQKISKANLILSNIEGALSALGDASTEAMETVEKELKEAEKDKEKAIKDLGETEKIYKESKEIWTLAEELHFIENKQSEHLSRISGINTKKVLLDRAQKADVLVDAIKKYKQAHDKLKKTEDELDKVLHLLPQIVEKLEDIKNQYESKVKESEELKPVLLDLNTKLNNALDIVKEIKEIDNRLPVLETSLKTLDQEIKIKTQELEKRKIIIEKTEKETDEQRNKIESMTVDVEYKKQIQNGIKLEKELSASRDNLAKLTANRDNIKSRLLKLEVEFSKASEQIKDTNNKLALLEAKKTEHQESRPGDRNEVTGLIEKYHELKSLFTNIKARTGDIKTANLRINDIEKQVGKQKLIFEETLQSKTALESKRNDLRDEIEQIRKHIEANAAYMLSRKLQNGEPCPVCGSKHHPQPATDQGIEQYVNEQSDKITQRAASLEEKLSILQSKLLEIETSLRESENKYISIEAQIKNLEEQSNQLMKDLESKKAEYEDLTLKLPENMREAKSDLIENEIENINKAAQEKLNQIVKWEQKLEALEENYKKGLEVLNKQKIEESRIASELNVNKENYKLAVKEAEDANKIFKQKESDYRAFIEKHRLNSISSELERINKTEEVIDKIQKDIRKQEVLIKSIRDRQEKLQEEKQELINKKSALEANVKNLKEQREQRLFKIKEFIIQKVNIENSGFFASNDIGNIEHAIESQLKENEAKLLNLSKEEKSLYENLKEQQEKFNILNMQKNTLENQKKIYTENYEAENSEVMSSLKEQGFTDIQEVEQAVMSKEDQSSIKKEIEEFERIERNLAAQKDIILKKLNNKTITQEQWNSISQLYQEKVSIKEEKVSCYEVAKNNFAKTKDKHVEWKKLNNDHKKFSRKSEMLDQLRGLLRGNSFIDYVAEERLRYVAREATEILGTMTSYRYALELDTDVGFVIRDYSNGGVTRMVTTLSGGETFITALSLALALSKQIQLKGQSPLEFFFLDEGFGTLDGNLLDLVLDSLEKLSNKERIIGVISHVPEMRARIARRLIVTPPSEDGVGSRVRIERG
jgi:exonuclease SbcC